MPARLQMPQVYPVVRDADGRLLLRLQQFVLDAGKSQGRILRAEFTVVPLKRTGRPIPMTAQGLVQPFGPTLLKDEIWLPAGIYRLARTTPPRHEQILRVLPEGHSLLRTLCGHGGQSPSWIEPLGILSQEGRQTTSCREVFMQACCRKPVALKKPVRRRHNARSIGLIQALTRPLEVLLFPPGNPANRRRVSLAPGESIVVDRDLVSTLAPGCPFPRHFRQVTIDAPEVERFLGLAELAHQARGFTFVPAPRPTSAVVAAAITGLEEAMRNPRGPGERHALAAALDHFLFTLLREFPNPIARAAGRRADKGQADPRLARAVAYLTQYYARPYDRDLLARYACVSHQRLYELFRAHLRTDPRAYLIRIRMKKAAELLASGRTTFAEAGKAVGYRNARSFRRLYARHAPRV